MSDTSPMSGSTEKESRLTRVELVVSGTDPPDDAVDLAKLVGTLWKGKRFIVGVTVLTTVIAVIVALQLPNQYKATAILMPASGSGSSSLSRLAGQFGGLASLAGITLDSQGEGNKITAAVELIKSWGFQEQFIRDNHLEVAVYAAKGWDRRTDQLIVDSSIYDVKHGKWVRQYDPDKGQGAEPSGWELYKKFSKKVLISQDKKTNLITFSVEYYSPYMAKVWADEMVTSVNKYLQERDRIEAEKSIQYLEAKMGQTGLTEMKTVFSRLIEEQTKNLMLARVSDEYVLKVLSPAKVPEEKSGPKRAMICLAAAFGGGLLSVFFWLFWSMRSVHQENPPRRAQSG